MVDERQERIGKYQTAYQQEYGFEATMVAARQRLVLELLEQAKPRVVVEVGCGTDLLFTKARRARIPVREWLIVEPAEEFARKALDEAGKVAGLHVLQGFIEDEVASVLALCPGRPDFVVCSGVLHEVPDVGRVLEAIRFVLGDGLAHFNVPNAFSFHRRLGRAMGVIADEAELTQRNRAMEQFRVFDMASLTRAIEDAGFRIEQQGGYFIKPFTHAQMESLGSVLTPPMLDGLWRLGQELPELASEIYVNARVDA